MLPKEERKAMLLRLYNDDSPLIDNSKDRFNKKQNSDAPDVAATDEGMVVDEEQNEDSAAPDRLENNEGDAGVQDDEHATVEDEAGANPDTATER